MQKVWASKFAARHPNVVVLDLSSFKCGHDAPIYGLIDSVIGTSATPYSALHDIDANKPGGSIKIRVKTYAHSLKLHEERLEDVAKKKVELVLKVEEKRLQLLELKQQQLIDRKQQDENLTRQIEDVRRRVAEYAARFTPTGATLEPAKGLLRIGIKRQGEEQVARL